MKQVATAYQFENVLEKAQFSEPYEISAAVYQNFLAAFQDHSPIHVDEAYARASGFKSQVMHGTLLNGFLSHFIGMRFPGKTALLTSVEIRYTSPCYLGDQLVLEATVTNKIDDSRALMLGIIFCNKTQGSIAARARVQVMVRHDG